MTNEPAGERLQLQMIIPEEMIVGSYANLLAVWHTAHEFTLDFGVGGRDVVDIDGESMLAVPVVARIKIPTNVIFDIAKAIAENVSNYEEKFGSITPLSDDTPMFPPGGEES